MRIPKHIFAIVKVAAKCSSRYGINGVNVSRDSEKKPTFAATDGKVLLVVKMNEQQRESEKILQEYMPEPKTISLDGWKTAEKLHHRSRLVELDESNINGHAEFQGISGKATVETHTMPFPKWEQVIPNPQYIDHTRHKGEYVKVILTPEVLSKLADSMIGLGAVHIELSVPVDGISAIKVEGKTENADEVVGAMMPCVERD